MARMKELWCLVSLLALIHCSKSACACDVICTTDYISTINCSRAELRPAASCHVQFQCSDDEIDESCEMTQSDHWCAIRPDDFKMMQIDTQCTVRVKQEHQTEIKETLWPLLNFVKPTAPFNVTLQGSGFDFNLTWRMAYTEDDFLSDFLLYRVRLRPRGGQETIYYNVTRNSRFLAIRKENVARCESYVVDVQAAGHDMMPTMWSDWSNTAELTTMQENCLVESPEWYFLFLLVVLPIAFIIVFIICTKIWAYKLNLNSVPNPRNFFKPLYHTYEGDFKKWVGPVLIFNSVDLLEKSPSVKVTCDKTSHSALDKGTEALANNLNTHGSRPGLFPLLQDPNYPTSRSGMSSHNTFPDTANGGPAQQQYPHHISIDTVMVSEEADPLEVVMPEEEEAVDHWLFPDPADQQQQQQQHVYDVEQLSLDSYGSSAYSEDGYPRVKLDLDTVDSGFMESECSSPGYDGYDDDEEEATAQQKETDPLHMGMGGMGELPHSNYVKQWVARPGQ